jgi:hypothetical protein
MKSHGMPVHAARRAGSGWTMPMDHVHATTMEAATWRPMAQA